MNDITWLKRYNAVVRERDQLRAHLADVTAQRDLLMAMCPAENENTRLRALLAQREAAIQEHLRVHAHLLHCSPECPCVVCKLLQPLRDALADLPDAPKVKP